MIADTKFERSRDEFGDEILTPDSSRFWDRNEWEASRAKGVSPTPYDKQSVRNWGNTVKTPFAGITGIGNLKPKNPDHAAFVHSIDVPPAITDEATGRYATIFKRITGFALQEFQRKRM